MFPTQLKLVAKNKFRNQGTSALGDDLAVWLQIPLMTFITALITATVHKVLSSGVVWGPA